MYARGTEQRREALKERKESKRERKVKRVKEERFKQCRLVSLCIDDEKYI